MIKKWLKKTILGFMIAQQQIGICCGSQDSYRTIKNLCRQHPVVVSLSFVASLYGGSYGLSYYADYNKKIHVNIIDIGMCNGEETAQENYLFSHGIAATHEQAYWYTKSNSTLSYIINGRLFTYDYPDASKRFWRVNFTQSGLGQHNDIMGLKSAYDQTIATLKQQEGQKNKIVLIGISRGATTILNFMGQQKPDHIKAIIVESPFDSTRTLSNNILSKLYLDNIPGVQMIGHYVMSAIFWRHSTRGEKAIDCVESIDKNVPILFVCSAQDTLVPKESTIALYEKLKACGHKKVHLFIASSGCHGKILHGDDGPQYQNVVHAFYKKYGLWHDALLAEQGKDLLGAA